MDFENTKFIQSMWIKDKFTGDVFVILSSRELVNKILKSQMSLEHIIKTKWRKLMFTVGSSSVYPSLDNFISCDEPTGINWRAYEKRDNQFKMRRAFFINIPPMVVLAG
jgi:hypothetical protein